MLLGRGTYDYWVGYWPTSDVEPFASFINGVSEARRHLERAHSGVGEEHPRHASRRWLRRCPEEPVGPGHRNPWEHSGRHRTVLWQSVVRQYLDATERLDLPSRIEQLGANTHAERPLTWLTLEPGHDHMVAFELVCHLWPGNRVNATRDKRRPRPAGQIETTP